MNVVASASTTGELSVRSGTRPVQDCLREHGFVAGQAVVIIDADAYKALVASDEARRKLEYRKAADGQTERSPTWMLGDDEGPWG
jgi:hypothetical protein